MPVYQLADGTTVEKTPADVTLEQITAEREAAMNAPVAYGGALWTGDARARELVTGVLSSVSSGAIPDTAVFPWRDCNGVTRNVDVPFLRGLAAAMVVQVSTAYATAWAQQDALAAPLDPIPQEPQP